MPSCSPPLHREVTMLLITGSQGLIGRALVSTLRARGEQAIGFDLRNHPGEDVLDADALARAALDCRGIIHLAAVSRVIWGEHDPVRCRATNVEGMRHVIAAALASPRRPWLLFASSREVYGQPEHLPVSESAPLAPVNVYGHTKVEAERMLAQAARERQLHHAIVRLSNVYGCIHDHEDRVVPAFARAAASGASMRIDGIDNTFDFTHVDDVTRALSIVIEHLDRSGSLPPVHLLTGRPTSLGRLAELAAAAGGGRSSLVEAPARAYDVARFHGDPRRARELLDWTAHVTIEQGIAQFVEQFRAQEQSP